ncbi:MAG: hypothetical protein AMK72_05880 [Planctomycetes bacterium SM23_25]|nr:MAG: hypothetical protein AMK72_05880 [Planctomycetes bacterium SM23_25]
MGTAPTQPTASPARCATPTTATPSGSEVGRSGRPVAVSKTNRPTASARTASHRPRFHPPSSTAILTAANPNTVASTPDMPR